MKRAILACSGMDKPEGSLAREVALLLSDASGLEIVCPVLLNRSPARYRKELQESGFVVIDGCATRCASKLASQMQAKIDRKVSLYEAVEKFADPIEPWHRLGPIGLAVARSIADRLLIEMNAGPADICAQAEWAPPVEYISVSHDKFEFRIPAADYWFNENDCWVRPKRDVARVGISDYMQQRLTDIGFFTPPELGANIEQFGELCAVESAKAVFDIISPVSGVVAAVNAAVMENPGLVNSDPYGAGWLAEIALDNFDEDKKLLIDGTDYSQSVKRKAAEP